MGSVALLTSCILLFVVCDGIGAIKKQALFVRRRSLDGLLGQTPVSAAKTRSRVECSSLCLSDDGCSSFTFAADSGDCFLHDSHSPFAGASHHGAATFYRKWDHCPETWVLLNATLCVKLFAENVAWDDAVQRCRSEGGNLLSVQTLAKDALVRNYLAARSSNYAWVGGELISGQWAWEATGEAATIFSWGDGQPSGPNEACLCIYLLDYRIHDAPCSMLLNVLCEIPHDVL